MISKHRIPIRKRQAVLFAATLVSLTLPSHIFAADAGSPRTNGQPRLATQEQVYQAIMMADRKRIALGGADNSIDNKAMREQWGVKIISTGYAPSGDWIEFRFRVLDADKASPLFDSMITPHLVMDARKNIMLGVPDSARVDIQRATNNGRSVQAGKIYSIMFANPKQRVKPGQKVTLVAGEFRVENMTVRSRSESLRIRQQNSGVMEIPAK